jgi:hypothetical protein
VAIYSVVNTVLLNPIPGPEPDRLVEIGERLHGNKDEPMFGGVSTPSLELLKDETRVLLCCRLDAGPSSNAVGGAEWNLTNTCAMC